jgi:CRP/FNR family transcriptional regulator, cyclic AMP receptor protein
MTKFNTQFNNETVQLFAGYNSLSNAGSVVVSASSNDLPKTNVMNLSDIPFDTLTFNEGDVIFKEGDLAKGVYILKTGCVKIYVNREAARGRTTTPEYVTKLVSPGEIFGYRSTILDSSSTCYAEAVKTSTVYFYPIRVIQQMMSGLNPILASMMKQSVSDLLHCEKISQFHYLASVQERIAYQIVTLADRFGVQTNRGISLNLKLTRNEFAQLASTINESLSRHLTEFKNEGLIDINGKEIIILNREALAGKSGNL